MCNDYEIRELPLSLHSCRRQAEDFLAANGLRMDRVDCYAAVFAQGEMEILGGGGLDGDVIKCLAVTEELRHTGMGLKLVSRLMSMAAANGYESVKVFTKPENRRLLEEMGFVTIAEAPRAILMESGQGLAAYCAYLSGLRREGVSGVIVMNGNPFTKGHRYLIERAMHSVDHLYVIVVREDVSLFSYEERKAMLTDGCKDLPRVTVCEGSSYVVSAATFPTYFLKEVTDATATHIALDLDLFVRHIAPALNVSVRFVGTESEDKLTAAYNEQMKLVLPSHGIEVMEVERLTEDGRAVSASAVRRALRNGEFAAAARCVWPSAVPCLLAEMATEALKKELDLTPKPGLVDRHDNGAHADMDYALMSKSIMTLRPYFAALARCGCQSAFPALADVRRIGMEAESAMFRATHGVNTHKGALFSLGLVVTVVAHLYHTTGHVEAESLRQGIARMATQFPVTEGTNGRKAVRCYHVRGALDNAAAAWPQLFDDWLPFLRAHSGDPYRLHKTLLRIMATLDDTNIYHRKGGEAAGQVREDAVRTLESFSEEALRKMNERLVEQNVSPGGSADMLALTCLISGVIH